MKILAIETSCDETAAAVIEDGTKIISNVIASSSEMNKKWGGVVPEVAARQQLHFIIPVIKEALAFSQTNLKSIDRLAVTVGPGLIGSLLIGVETAKTIAMVTGKPIIPVNHVLAHMYANFFDQSLVIPGLTGNPSTVIPSPIMDPRLRGDDKKAINFPAISLVVSGGHTELYLMKTIRELNWLGGTLDDAAGEAFDKSARLLEFGTGGGLAIEKAAKKFTGNYNSPASPSYLKRRLGGVTLPRPMIHEDNLNFSFSGLKTAILREVNKLKINQQFNKETIEQLSFEIQEAITDVLVAKTIKAARQYQAKSILISGGVAANSRLREKFIVYSSQFTVTVPEVSLCTDNASYIGSYAFFRGKPVDWHGITATPDLSVEVDA